MALLEERVPFFYWAGLFYLAAMFSKENVLMVPGLDA